MEETFNIYCDESCHLEHDSQTIMLLGSIWCPKDNLGVLKSELNAIKSSHNSRGEIKWTKVSPSREDLYLELVDFFFSKIQLNFRCLIVENKQILNHSFYNMGDHDSFYYKMYFYLLRNIMAPKNRYNIYIDIKDTRSQIKINKLKDVLCNNFHDFDREMIPIIQHVRSKEVDLLQLADFFMGAVSYQKRGLATSQTKLRIINKIKECSKSDLLNTTPPWDEKFNLFFFSPKVD